MCHGFAEAVPGVLVHMPNTRKIVAGRKVFVAAAVFPTVFHGLRVGSGSGDLQEFRLTSRQDRVNTKGWSMKNRGNVPVAPAAKLRGGRL
jgi:hypothetical protein